MVDVGGMIGPPARLVRTSKPGGTRWLAVLEPGTAAAYAAAVAAVAPAIEASLRPEVLANRVAVSRGSLLLLQPWRAARTRFLARARVMAASSGAVLVTDVRECYPSIVAPTVATRLDQLGCRRDDAGRITDLLERLATWGVRGLPIGPAGSAVLANAVLATADEAVADAGAVHLRWVDDFVVFTLDPDRARDVLDRLRSSLAQLGLAIAEHKTIVACDPGAIERALSGAVSRTGARYHRRADAHPLPGLEGPHALASPDGGVDPRRRQTRSAGGSR